MPPFVGGNPQQADPTPTAVLVPVQSGPGGRSLVTLIRRSRTARVHAGESAFPGGRFEPGRDESLLAAALREASEEIGVDPADVELLGVLPERRTFSSNYLVTPFVGRLPFPSAFRGQEGEVERVFSLDLGLFANRARRSSREWYFSGRRYRVPCVAADGELVWGLTLDIIDDLIASGLAGAAGPACD